MNKKRTNYLITILNILAIISFYLFYFGSNYLMANMFHEGDSAECIYGSQIIDFLLINIKKIILIFNISIAIFNIICAIQNRKNKKLCFWYFTFGIIEISSAIDIGFYLDTIFDIKKYINKVIFTGIPIILVIKNCILIKRNRPTKLEIISYILAVIIAIVEIFEYINPGNCWLIVSIIMQFIYNHNQENNCNENNIKKFINIILYYIIQTLIVGSFSFMIIYSLIFTKVNNTRFDNEILQLFNNITTLKNSKNQEIYIPVEKKYKYGFIDTDGEEKISCKYDRVTYFNKIEIDNSSYCVALAKKNNNYYIISKSNDSIKISDYLNKYFRFLEKHIRPEIFGIEKYEEYRIAYVQSCNFIFEIILNKENIDYEVQTLQIYDSDNSEGRITLKEKENSNKIKYYYNNKNYSITIEPIDEDDNKEYDEYNEYDEEEYNQDYGIIYDFSQSEKKYKVSIIKSNGEKTSSIVYLPNFNENRAILGTFTNGYIEFISEDKVHKGWYDNNGDKIEISNIYEITDIRDNKVILKWDNSNDENYNDDDYVYEQKNYIIDSFGNILLQAKALCILDKDLYLVKNDNNKMILMDKDLNVISNEYDKIIASAAIDLLAIYSSYFE